MTAKSMRTPQTREPDSNRRPPGYEPDELPLLYPADKVKRDRRPQAQMHPAHRPRPIILARPFRARQSVTPL
jgi:hypothetical protein